MRALRLFGTTLYRHELLRFAYCGGAIDVGPNVSCVRFVPIAALRECPLSGFEEVSIVCYQVAGDSMSLVEKLYTSLRLSSGHLYNALN